MSYIFVALTVLLTVYGQLVLKWQVGMLPPAPDEFPDVLVFMLRTFMRPWVITGLAAAVLASACWIAAVSRFELSKIYPYMALNFVIVGLVAAPLFGEALSTAKLVGLVLVVAGLIVTSQG